MAGEGAKYNIQQCCICCHGHILNIAVQAFFFSEDKEAVNTAFKEAHKALKAEADIELNKD